MRARSVPQLKACAQVVVDVGAPIELEGVGSVWERVVPILGGSVTGELAGTILPGGADWQTVHDDGLTQLAARYPVRLDSGRTVCFVATGVRSIKRADGAFSSTLRIEPLGTQTYPIYVTVGVKRDNQVHFDMFEVS